MSFRKIFHNPTNLSLKISAIMATIFLETEYLLKVKTTIVPQVYFFKINEKGL